MTQSPHPVGPVPAFQGGFNMAIKIPLAEYEATVAFYRDTLGLEVREETDTGARSVSRTHAVRFGPNTLWLDRVDSYSRPDLWLELRTDDLDAATSRLAAAGITPCDEIERFDDPKARAHWIKNPAGIVHLLAEHSELSAHPAGEGHDSSPE